MRHLIALTTCCSTEIWFQWIQFWHVSYIAGKDMKHRRAVKGWTFHLGLSPDNNQDYMLFYFYDPTSLSQVVITDTKYPTLWSEKLSSCLWRWWFIYHYHMKKYHDIICTYVNAGGNTLDRKNPIKKIEQTWLHTEIFKKIWVFCLTIFDIITYFLIILAFCFFICSFMTIQLPHVQYLKRLSTLQVGTNCLVFLWWVYS